MSPGHQCPLLFLILLCGSFLTGDVSHWPPPPCPLRRPLHWGCRRVFEHHGSGADQGSASSPATYLFCDLGHGTGPLCLSFTFCKRGSKWISSESCRDCLRGPSTDSSPPPHSHRHLLAMPHLTNGPHTLRPDAQHTFFWF